MQPVSHVLDYYKHALEHSDAAHWPHLRLREAIRHYEIVNARWTLRQEDAQNKLLENDQLNEEHR